MDAAFDNETVDNEFSKLPSGQPNMPRASEAELLTSLHTNRRVSRLGRHYPGMNVGDVGDTAIFEPSGGGLDIIHFVSTGQLLSQCEIARDMLDRTCDLTKVHTYTVELDVLQRDVSRFNVLCNTPRRHLLKLHRTREKDVVVERPCIAQIFGNPAAERCLLSTDLDRAPTFEELAKEPESRTVGTPMFMSVYLASPSALWEFLVQPLRKLREQLQAIEAHHDVFELAFPNDDGTFMATFQQVTDAEELRDVEPEAQIPQARHDPRHDAESFYWVFLWAFARAHQRPASGRSALFREAMLQHDLANDARDIWLSPGEPTRLFAQDLARVQVLFQRIAAYLSIPWHLYCGLMERCPEHAYVALRRLILGFMLDAENQETLGIQFDTAAPRVTTNSFDRDRRNSGTTDTRGSSATTELVPPPPGAMKRKVEADATDVGDRRRKKIKTHGAPDIVSEGAGPS